MNPWKPLAHLLLLAIAFSTVPAQAETDVADELARVDQRIQFIEANLIKMQGERFRARHEMEYGDAELSPKYQDAKAREKQLIEKRKQVDVHLLATDPTVATLETNVKELNARLREMRLLDDAIGREISSAGNSGDLSRQADLEAEKHKSAPDIRALEGSLQEAIAALTEKRRTITEADPETARLVQELITLEQEHQQAMDEVKRLADSSDPIKALDAQRQELATELQNLRTERKRLLESTIVPP